MYGQSRLLTGPASNSLVYYNRGRQTHFGATLKINSLKVLKKFKVLNSRDPNIS